MSHAGQAIQFVASNVKLGKEIRTLLESALELDMACRDARKATSSG